MENGDSNIMFDMKFNIYAMAKPSTEQEYLDLIKEAHRELDDLELSIAELDKILWRNANESNK